jgi:hypothetical protein
VMSEPARRVGARGPMTMAGCGWRTRPDRPPRAVFHWRLSSAA